MTRDFLVRAAALTAISLLAACGGGGGSSSDGGGDGLGGGGDGGGDFDLNVPGASPEFLNSIANQTRIFEGSIVASGNGDFILPPTGSATYTGSGTIFDSSLTGDDDSVAELRNRALVVTDVSANVAFGGSRAFTVTQGNFRNIEGAPISGSATWTGTFTGDNVYNGQATGTIGGTSFATASDGAAVVFYGTETDSAIIGAFEGAVGSGGAFNGVTLNGTIAAEKNP